MFTKPVQTMSAEENQNHGILWDNPGMTQKKLVSCNARHSSDKTERIQDKLEIHPL
jgi:hypothetical protein